MAARGSQDRPAPGLRPDVADHRIAAAQPKRQGQRVPKKLDGDSDHGHLRLWV